MKCKRPFYLEERAIMVPCRKCTYCRIARRREWVLRILHESLDWKSSCFVTLTYADEHLPIQPFRPVHFPVLPSLSKSDLQKFFKRLRKQTGRFLRYYACGEYGENGTFRPHYHAIIFGVDAHEVEIVKSAWPLGIVDVGFAEPDSISYVAQYIDKKRYGEGMLFGHYRFVQPEFQVQSMGIGRRYIDREAGATLRRGALLRYAKEIGLPRYYEKRLRIGVNPDVRALDWHVFSGKRQEAVVESQVALCEDVAPDVGGIPYREMSEDEFRVYCDGLLRRNKAIDRELVGQGKIKKLRSERL